MSESAEKNDGQDNDTKDGALIKNDIQVITIIGEIEGHDNLPAASKATKYEHMLPKLTQIEMDDNVKGVLFVINTVGGDVSAGLALAEMIASMSKPTVSLIIGDSHSIGVPLAVSTKYSFIVPTATMIIHPVRMNGTLLGVRQTYDYFERISDRITSFIAKHSKVSKDRVEQMMVDTTQLSKDLGTVLVGRQAVEEGLICEVGGISKALEKLRTMINDKKDNI
ncbi:MAG: ClpP family protease [Lachnospira sp.]